jgi:hypothetical protein
MSEEMQSRVGKRTQEDSLAADFEPIAAIIIASCMPGLSLLSQPETGSGGAL